MASEPRWSVTDLAENKKVNVTTLHLRAKKTPLPEPLVTKSGFGTARHRTQHVRYARSALLNWFEEIEKLKPVKRNDA